MSQADKAGAKINPVNEVENEIAQAKRASVRNLIFHVLLTGSTVLAGVATTFFAADIGTGNANKPPEWVAPLLAAITTGLGATANQTDFKKKAAGYRLTKTEFQNLQLDRSKEKPDYPGDAYIKRIEELRSLKIARTSDEG